MAESIAGAGTREALESGRLSPSQYGLILSSIKEAGGEASRIAGLEAQAAGFDALVSLWYRGNHPAAMETLRAGIVGLQGALADGGLGKISPQLEAGFEMGVVFGRAEGAASIAPDLKAAAWIEAKAAFVAALNSPDRAPALAAKAGFERAPEVFGFVAESLEKQARWGVDAGRAIQPIAAGFMMFLSQLVPAEGLRAGAAKVPLLHRNRDGSLWIGSRRVDWGDLRMAGYRANQVPEDMHDAPHCRAVVIGSGEVRLAVVSVDFCNIYQDVILGYPEIVARVRERVASIDPTLKNILIVATHTHSSYECSLAFKSPKIGEATVPGLIGDAILLAAANCEPAKIAFGEGLARVNYNRTPRVIDQRGKAVGDPRWGRRGVLSTETLQTTRDEWVRSHPQDPVDEKVVFMHIKRADPGSRNPHIATVINHACHAVVMGPENRRLSADFPGVATALLEATFGREGGNEPEATPYAGLFLQGCAGDMNPWFALSKDTPEGWRRVEEAGVAVASAAVDEIARIPDAGYRAELPIAFKTIKESIEPVIMNPEPYSVEVNVVTFGDRARLVTFPAEIFSEVGLEIRKAATAKGIAQTMVCGYTNDALGYIPSAAMYNAGSYETDGHDIDAASYVLCKKETADILAKAVKDAL
ncbi:hypothetical protein [Singulisphaera sp. PoT]|uniref:hypothetical protein n=1 Tax=Singulisphaera sp. PoT TaxID=3411797 RepID=UPI003BF4AEB4